MDNLGSFCLGFCRYFYGGQLLLCLRKKSYLQYSFLAAGAIFSDFCYQRFLNYGDTMNFPHRNSSTSTVFHRGSLSGGCWSVVAEQQGKRTFLTPENRYRMLITPQDSDSGG
jgi:hypothetical protein